MSTAVETEYRFAPSERPALPGAPFIPAHPPWRRAVYIGVALWIAIAATLGNSLVTVNVSTLAGSLGEYVTLVTMLPAVGVAMSASGNLSLVKGRIQFGIPALVHGLLIAYVLAGLLQFVFPGFASAVVVRAVSGITSTALIPVTIYYLMQAFPASMRPAAVVAGIGLIQLGSPVARMFPVELLAEHGWRGLILIEIAVPLATLALMMLFPLPPTEKSKAFEPLDFATIALVIPAMLGLCIVIGEGRLLWWADTPWLGRALALTVPLFAAAIVIEMHRARPLLHLSWIGSAGVLRLMGVALLVRLALAEQTYGSVGFLTAGGLTNDQLRILFAFVIGAMLLGTTTAVLTLRPLGPRLQVVIATLVIALANWLDSHTTSDTRPQQLYLSQALVGFGTTLFIGPSLAIGFQQMMQKGPAFFVSLVVIFSATQNVGGLAGSAFLGSYQEIATQAHAQSLSEHLLASDPQVVARVESQGVAQLVQSVRREAGTLAFDDMFRAGSLLALATALVELLLMLRDRWQARREASRLAHA
jgi:MFS family permease